MVHGGGIDAAMLLAVPSGSATVGTTPAAPSASSSASGGMSGSNIHIVFLVVNCGANPNLPYCVALTSARDRFLVLYTPYARIHRT